MAKKYINLTIHGATPDQWLSRHFVFSPIQPCLAFDTWYDIQCGEWRYEMWHDWCSDISHQIWNMGRSPSYRLILRFSPWFSCWLGFDIWILAIRISFGGFWAALDTLSVYSLAGLGLYFYIWKLLYLYFDAGRLFCL